MAAGHSAPAGLIALTCNDWLEAPGIGARVKNPGDMRYTLGIVRLSASFNEMIQEFAASEWFTSSVIEMLETVRSVSLGHPHPSRQRDLPFWTHPHDPGRTFALLLARQEGVDFGDGDLQRIARLLGKKHLLLGKAHDVLTSDRAHTRIAVDILVRVIRLVD